MNEPTEKQTRERAIKLYSQGMQVSAICRELSRSRAWFYKWLRRYESGDQNWSEARSKAPHTVANKTPTERVHLVLRIRNDLETTPGSRIGASHIQARMADLEWEPLPKRTINRILKQHHAPPMQPQTKRRKHRRRRNISQKLTSSARQLSLF